MPIPISRREILSGGVAAGALLALGPPEWALPALAQGETLVAFTDIPETFTTNPTVTRASEQLRVSRVTDAEGRVQPRAADPESKLTTLENNAQFPRRVRV